MTGAKVATISRTLGISRSNAYVVIRSGFVPPMSTLVSDLAVYPNWTRHFGIGSMNLRGDEFNGNTPPGFGWAQAL